MTLEDEVARALERALAFEVESNVYAGETTHEERLALARAAIAVIEPRICEEERMAVAEWLRTYDAELVFNTHPAYLKDGADVIEAGEHVKAQSNPLTGDA